MALPPNNRRVVVGTADLGHRPATACPRCGAALSSVDRATLRPVVHHLFRCPPGTHPRVFEARCGGCGRLLVVQKTDAGLVLAGADQDGLLRIIRERDRAAREE